MNNIVGPASLLGALLLGIALLWSLRLAYGARRVVVDDSLRLILTIAAWLLIHVGVFSLAAQIFYSVPDVRFGLGAWIVGMVFLTTIGMGVMLSVFGMAVARFRALEWTSLLWMLSAAADKGIPLHEAAHAFALERGDEIGVRTERLAQLLERGVALPVALQQSRTNLPTDGLLAARYGTETGNLFTSISGMTHRSIELDILVRNTVEKCFYLALVVWMIIVQMSFLWWRIIPIYSVLFDEFGVTLPRLTAQLLEFGAQSTSLSIVIFPGLLLFWLLTVVALLYYLGWLSRDFPGLSRLTRRYDGALIMRALAVAVDQAQPLPRAIWTLSRMYPRRAVRRRLASAGTRMNNGEHWCDSMTKARLIKPAEAGVLKAAERVGNLQWAFQEMADSTLRRLAYRLRLALGCVFPAILLGIGCLIAIFVIGMFLPLVELIQGLA